MIAFKGRVIDAEEQREETDDFLKRVEELGYTTASGGKKKGASERLQEATSRAASHGNAASFVQVMEGMNELVAVQREIDRTMGVSSSHVLQLRDEVTGRVMLFVTGRRPEHRSLDDLFTEEVGVIKGLSGSVEGAIAYSNHVESQLVAYMKGTTLAQITQSTAQHSAAEKRAYEALALLEEARNRLAQTRVTDAGFSRLYEAHYDLEREARNIQSQLAKADQKLVFRTDELKILRPHLAIITETALFLDQTSGYVADVADHVENTSGAYRYNRESEEGMSAMYHAFRELSRCVLRGAADMDGHIKRITGMAKATTNDNLLPVTLGKLIKRYESTILDAGARSRAGFGARAERIRESYATEI